MAFYLVSSAGDSGGSGDGNGIFFKPHLYWSYGCDSGDCNISVSGFVEIYNEAVGNGKAFVCHGGALFLFYGSDSRRHGAAGVADVLPSVLYDDFSDTGSMVLSLYVHD